MAECRRGGQIHPDLPKCVLDIYLTHNDRSRWTESLTQVHNACQNIRQNVFQCQLRGLLEIGDVVYARPVACRGKRQVVNDSQLPPLHYPQWEDSQVLDLQDS